MVQNYNTEYIISNTNLKKKLAGGIRDVADILKKKCCEEVDLAYGFSDHPANILDIAPFYPDVLPPASIYGTNGPFSRDERRYASSPTKPRKNMDFGPFIVSWQLQT